ncbi:rhamnan synthesis F family protein [Piscinibacter gummiphilus]|uniref:Uncharacterized protein n=1 Tax=Piscinibacter gummiphilus TaxID=946333 RepID=A0A1W6L7X8_9BURK|nr:rhamnan synthesis F family protein [Piscinibacter gummiphilus]ARN20439.1 hypothetical protein A4W93_11320 [Piscinibacter gummiphilus]ATU65114.1 hypothetical protein CPZ87_11395 [Piscinibacter gummiphilus]GLS98493.1 hypothetical protein GCM10007918_57850 [Piscinibacter gummiphilus]
MTRSNTLRDWRRSLKDRLPYVRRRVHASLERRYALLTDALGMGVPRAADVTLTVARPVRPGDADELCLFLSHQAAPALKPHVVAHVTALLDRGVRVVLVLNTDLPADTLRIDPAFADRLDGLLVRQNLGYDFAGWAHAHAVVSPHLRAQRLYLVNDSIVGPLDGAAFDRLLARVRSSRADVVGLIEAPTPRPHLQSFFLAFNARALAGGLVPFFREVLCFADKGTVVDVYETHLTQRLRHAGFACEAVFPTADPYAGWEQLVADGFPYVKGRALAEHRRHPAVARLVPPHLLAD